jgi:uncharacterized membrane protein/YHS domain-containing protein
VLTEEEADPKITTSYQGKTVAFCCKRCRAKFKADPEKYISGLPQFADATASSAPEVAGTQAGPRGAEVEAEDASIPLPGRLHPAIVHFPLAGIPIAFLGVLIWTWTGRPAFAKADVPPLVVGTLAAVAAVLTGNIAHDSMRFSPSMHTIVEQHQTLSTSIMVLTLVLTALRIWRWNHLTGRWRWVYGGGLLVTSAMLGLTGYLGGSLVFGPDHLGLGW